MKVENSNPEEDAEAEKRKVSIFTSGDHWNHSLEKLKSWRTVQTAILGKLNTGTGEADPGDDITVTHGFELLKTMRHSEAVRSFTYVKTMHGLVFITNSGNDLRSYMNVWNLQGLGAENVNKKRVSIVTKCTLLKYLPKQRKLISYSPDQKLKVLDDVTRGFDVICEVTTPSSLFCLEWNPDTEELVCGGSQGICTYKITEEYQLVISRSYNARLSWCSSIHIDTDNKLMMAVCDQKIYVYNYERGNCTHVFQNRHTLALTCCAFYEPKDLFLTASKDGTIKLWNGLAFTLVHEIMAHSSTVTGLEIYRTDSLLFSCSTDYTVKVWRLDTYELFMRIDVGEKIRGMRIIGVSELFLWTDRQIRTYRVNMIYGFYAPVYSTVHNLMRVDACRFPASIVCSSSDGVVRIYTSLSANTYTTIFPQKSFQILKEVVYIRAASKFLAVLDSGDVVVHDTSTNPATPSHILEADVKYDEQITSITQIKRDRALGEKETADSDTLVFAGHKNGEISLLYSTRCKLQDICRAHLAPVDILETSEGKLQSQSDGCNSMIGCADRLISSSKDLKVKVWCLVFEDEYPYLFSLVCLKLIDGANIGVPVKVCMLESTLAVSWATKHGVSRLSMYQLYDDTPAMTAAVVTAPGKKLQESFTGAANRGIIELTHDETFDHTGQINGLAAHSYHNIFVTTSWDGYLKVWDKENVLIRELMFDESLSCCCFADNKGTILIGYKNHINSVSLENYLPYDRLRKVLLEDFQDEEDELARPYQAFIQEPDMRTLAREPAVNNKRRNARLHRDTKSGWISTHQKIKYRANSTYIVDEVPDSDDEAIEDMNAGRSASTSRTAWRKLGVTNRMVNILASIGKVTDPAQSSRASSATGRKRSAAHTKHRPVTQRKKSEGFDSKAIAPITKAQFEVRVREKQKEKQDAILEEQKRRMEVARQLEQERKNRSQWLPIAPDGQIPNSVIRNILNDLCGQSKRSSKNELAFFDIAMLIAKLPGLNGAEKSVNDYLVKKGQSNKKIPSSRSGKGVKSKPQVNNSPQQLQQEQKVVSLVPDDATQMLMQPLNWCSDHIHSAVPEVFHFYMRNDDVIDLDPELFPLVDEIEKPLVDTAGKTKWKGALDKKRQGIDLLKRISKEPWWNNTANLTVIDALHQIIKLLPRAVSRLHTTLLGYLVEIAALFGFPDALHLPLADALFRNIHSQKENERAVMATLTCIGDTEFGTNKVIAELARIVQTDTRKAVVAKASELLRRFTEGTRDITDDVQLEELSRLDDRSAKQTFNKIVSRQKILNKLTKLQRQRTRKESPVASSGQSPQLSGRRLPVMMMLNLMTLQTHSPDLLLY